MEVEVLKMFADELEKLGIYYEYGELTKTLKYPYVVGEFSEHEYTFEDNSTGGEMILTAFNRGSELALIQLKEKIKQHFNDFRYMTSKGSIFVSYTQKLFIRSGEMELKKMEMYLDVRYWKGE